MKVYPLFQGDTCWTDVPPYDGFMLETTCDHPLERPIWNYDPNGHYPEDQPAPPEAYRDPTMMLAIHGESGGRKMTQANLEALTREVERQSAIVDCKNLMGKVMYYGAAWLNRKMVELCGGRQDDCLLEQPWGIYDGRVGVERCYLQDFGDRHTPGWEGKA